MPVDPAPGERRVELHEREVADEAVVVAAEALEATTPTDQGPTLRSRQRRAATVEVGCARSDSKSIVAARRWSAVARCWARPRRRSSTGESRASASCVDDLVAAGARDRALERCGRDGPRRAVRTSRGRRRARRSRRGGAGSRRTPAPTGRSADRGRSADGSRSCRRRAASMKRAVASRLLVRGANDDAPVGPLVGARRPPAGERAAARSRSEP